MFQPQLTRGLFDCLEKTCDLPFADIREHARLTGASESVTAYRLDRLTELGLVSGARHGAGRLDHTRRFFPTAEGIRSVADRLGTTPDELWEDRPVHPKVFRSLIRRIDVVAVIYRLTTRILDLMEVPPTATVDHFFSGPYDAIVRLDTGPTIGIVCFGRAQRRSTFTRNWGEVIRKKSGWPDAVLVLTTAQSDLWFAYWRMETRPGPPAYCAVEDNALAGAAESHLKTWGSPSGPETLTSLPAIVGELPSDQESSPLAPSTQGSAALSRYPETLAADHPAFHLTASEKALLDTIYDWPLIRRRHLPPLLGVSSPRVSQMIRRLESLEMITQLNLRGAPSYALSDEGLGYVSYRDRVAVGGVFRALSVEGPRPERWFGGRMRTLYREFSHTDIVNWLVSGLAAEARELDGYRLVQLDPPPRSVREFVLDGRNRAAYPDASGRIQYSTSEGERHIPFVLEMERGHIDAPRAANKIHLYRDFFASGDQWNIGMSPLVLFVFDTPAEELRFFRAAMAPDSEEASVPFALSNLERIRRTGFLGASWLLPEEGGQDRREYIRDLESDLTDT